MNLDISQTRSVIQALEALRITASSLPARPKYGGKVLRVTRGTAQAPRYEVPETRYTRNDRRPGREDYGPLLRDRLRRSLTCYGITPLGEVDVRSRLGAGPDVPGPVGNAPDTSRWTAWVS